MSSKLNNKYNYNTQLQEALDKAIEEALEAYRNLIHAREAVGAAELEFGLTIFTLQKVFNVSFRTQESIFSSVKKITFTRLNQIYLKYVKLLSKKGGESK